MDRAATRAALRQQLLVLLRERRAAKNRQRNEIADELAALRARHAARTEGAQRG